MPSSQEKINAWKRANPEKMWAAYLRYKAKHPEKFPIAKPLLTEEERLQRRNDTSKRWRQNNLEKARAADARYLAANKEKKAARSKLWREKNAEHVRELKRAWTAAHPGHGNERARRWAAANPEKSRAQRVETTRRWQERNPDQTAVYRSRSHVKRKSALEDVGRFTLQEWNDLLDRTGHKCVVCGIPEAESIYRFPRKGFPLRGKLTIDHVVPLSKEGRGTIDNIAPLCLPCNMRKHNKKAA